MIAVTSWSILGNKIEIREINRSRVNQLEISRQLLHLRVLRDLEENEVIKKFREIHCV